MIVKVNECKEDIKEGLRGGNGSAILNMIHQTNDFKNVKMMTTVTLKPGCSIGFHEHIEETEYYYILEGNGLVKESSGETVVGKGDTVITTDKQTHAIENQSDKDLVFLAIIVTF